MTKIDKIIFAIVALVFIGGGILCYIDYKDAVETREKVKQEYIERMQPIMKNYKISLEKFKKTLDNN